jgi:hypothetical protein
LEKTPGTTVKLISNGTAFKSHLIRLFTKYPHIRMAVVWASAGTVAFKTFAAHRVNIKQAVIGNPRHG